MSIRAITFDFWGTLFADKNDEARHAARVDAFVAASGQNRDAVHQALLEAHKEFFRVHVEEQRTLLPIHAVDMTCQALGCPLSQAVRAHLASIFGRVILDHPPALIEHALEAVQAAAERFPVALISDTGISPGASLAQLLDRHGFSAGLQVRTFSDEVGVAKPQAPMFLRTAEALGVAPAELLHLGDLEPTDIKGVQAVGGKGGLFAGVNRRFVDTTQAEHVFHSWKDFLEILDTLG